MLTADNAGQTLNSLGVSAGPSSPVAAGNLAGAATPGVTPGQHAQTPATMVAAPQEVVDIVSNRLAGDDRPDKIMVQLDPPELGRVSIEFKFDAQGLSQVAVRGESAEAIKQLRLLHFDLVQSLEQHGLSARAMTFSQNFSQQQQQQDLHDRFNPALASEEDLAGTPPPIAEQARNTPAVYGSSGLNIKL
jgi:flagellar hook-length control protein FliK